MHSTRYIHNIYIIGIALLLHGCDKNALDSASHAISMSPSQVSGGTRALIEDVDDLMLMGHTDTVEYIEGWNTNPFELTLKDGKLYGLGTCDMKGGVAAILKAVSEIDFSKLIYGIKLYFTYDEEISFKGMYEIVESKEKFPEVMIFGEPTNNEKMIGSKGLLEYEIEFLGVKAHSSNPVKGISANLNAVKFLNEINEFYENNIKEFKDSNFEIPYTTMNIGTINGGSNHEPKNQSDPE